MKNTKFIATVLVAGMLVTGCGIGGCRAIIKVNNAKITQGEFDRAMDKQIAMSPLSKMGGDVKKNKDGMFYLMAEKAIINQLIVKKILDAELKNRGIKIEGKEVDAAIDKIIDKMGSKDQLSKLLKQNGISIKDFKSDIKNQVKLQKLARSAGEIKVSDAEVRDFYNKNRELFTHKEQVRAYHILIPTNMAQLEQDARSASKRELSPEEVKKRVDKALESNTKLAQKLAKELKADGSKFENYARKYSKDYMSAERGGDLGYFERERMVPEFSVAAFNAKPNTVVGPIQTIYGLHIIKVTDRIAAGTEPFEKVQSDIRDRLQTQKEMKVLDDIMAAAKKKLNIVYVDKDYDPAVVDKKLQKQMQALQNAARQGAGK